MLAAQRHKLIIEELRRDGAVRVSELTALLAVSEMTVRRDLDALAGSRPAGEGPRRRHLSWQPQRGGARLRGEVASPAEGEGSDRARGGPTHRAGPVGRTHCRHDDLAARPPPRATARPDGCDELDPGGERATPRAAAGSDRRADRRHANAFGCSCRADRPHRDSVASPRHALPRRPRSERRRRASRRPTCSRPRPTARSSPLRERIVVVADHTKWGVRGLSQIAGLDQVDVFVSDHALDGRRAAPRSASSVERLLIAPIRGQRGLAGVA